MEKIQKLIVTIIASCIITYVSAQDTIRHLSLAQACRLAVDSNTNVLNAKLETQKTHYQTKETQSKLYPQLEGYSDFNYYYAIQKMLFPGEFFGETGEIPVEIGTKYEWNSGFKASLTLYNQSLYTSIKLAKRMQSISELSLEQKKEELVYQVSQVYFLCKSTSSQVSFLEKNMQNTDHLLEILHSQNENGVARKIDYTKVQVTKNNLQTQIDNLIQLEKQQLALLKFLIGINPGSQVELTDSLSFTSESPNFQLPDFNQRTDVGLLNKQIEVTTLNKKANMQAYLPTLSASAQHFYQGLRNEFDYFKGRRNTFFKVGYIGVSLSIPIFDGFEKHSKNQQYNIELQQLQNSLKNTTTSYNKDFIDAINQYSKSLKALLRQQENIKIAEDDYNVTLQGYRQQIVLLSDLMLSENSLTEARLSFVDALLTLKNAELELKKLKNELLKF
jgi:Outer membrane protein